MFGSIKDRIVELGEGLRVQVLGHEGVPPPEGDGLLCLADPGAGGEVLAHWEEGWSRLHEGAEQVARQADRTDREVGRVHAEYEKQWRHVSLLSSLVRSTLPDIHRDVVGVMRDLAELESLFMEVELSLLALEDTIDAREAQEKQLEQRFQMALHQERRRQELEEFEQQLETAYRRRCKEREEHEVETSRKKQQMFQARFEEDLANFSKTGMLAVPQPRKRPTDVSLISIDLGEEGNALEAFLGEEDGLNLSPLPRDDIPLVQGTLTPPSPIDRPATVSPSPLMVSPTSPLVISPTSPVRLVVSSPSLEEVEGRKNVIEEVEGREEVSSISGDQSVYFTPDTTMERIHKTDQI